MTTSDRLCPLDLFRNNFWVEWLRTILTSFSNYFALFQAEKSLFLRQFVVCNVHTASRSHSPRIWQRHLGILHLFLGISLALFLFIYLFSLAALLTFLLRHSRFYPFDPLPGFPSQIFFLCRPRLQSQSIGYSWRQHTSDCYETRFGEDGSVVRSMPISFGTFIRRWTQTIR